jgi:hypothetical protein
VPAKSGGLTGETETKVNANSLWASGHNCSLFLTPPHVFPPSARWLPPRGTALVARGYHAKLHLAWRSRRYSYPNVLYHARGDHAISRLPRQTALLRKSPAQRSRLPGCAYSRLRKKSLDYLQWHLLTSASY